MSANWDEEIGDIIADAMDKVGKDGTITVEEAKSHRDHPRRGGGHAVRQGLPVAVLRDRHRERMEAVLEDAYILIHEKKISNLKDMLPLLEKVAKTGKPCSSSPKTSKAKLWPRSW